MNKTLTGVLGFLAAISIITVSAQAPRYANWADRDNNGVIDLNDKATAVAYYDNNLGALKRTPRPTNQPTSVPTATNTAVPTLAPSATVVASATPTVIPTPVPTVAPTALPTMPPVATGQPVPVAGQECPAWVHDQYVVAWEDGHTYPTWHPNVDPTYGCFFTHEHGDDPRTSLVFDGKMPPFGLAQHYVPGHVHGEGDEPHTGFKVFVANNGDVNDENVTAIGSSMIVFHMGTSGLARTSVRHHSMEYRMQTPDGYKAHVFFMADTNNAGDICQRDNPANAIGRTLAIYPQDSTCNQDSQYEIWAGGTRLKLPGYEPYWGFTFGASVATFDTATYVRKSNGVFTSVVPSGEYGCRREAYHEGGNWEVHGIPSGGQSFVWKTDAFGEPLGPNDHGITQRVTSMGYKIGVTRNTKPGSENIFKKISENCTPNIRMPN